MTSQTNNTLTAFVLMPFGEDFDSVYDDLISPALTQAGFVVTRADEIDNQQSVMKDIVTSLAFADLIVADLTGANPNVYYEVGIAHGLRQNVILMTQDIDRLPFDLKSYRVVEYSLLLRDAKRASERLESLAQGAHSGTTQFGSPVSDFLEPSLPEPTAPQPEIDPSPLGILDYQEQFEKCTNEITSTITTIGTRTESYGNVLRDGTATLQELQARNERPSPRQVRAALAGITEATRAYSDEMSQYNRTFEELLPQLESSLEGLIHGQSIESQENRTEFEEAMDTIEGTLQSFQEGIDGTMSMKQAVDSMPNLERNLNSANGKLSRELQRFIANMSRTKAITNRAVELGRSRLSEQAVESELSL